MINGSNCLHLALDTDWWHLNAALLVTCAVPLKKKNLEKTS